MADALTSALNAYRLPATKATAVTSEMVAAVGAGKMHMQDFAGSLSAVLPIAASAHISFAQVGGAVATMTSQGMSAQQATQDLANTIRGLVNPNQVAVNEMQQLGLNSTQVAQQLGKAGLTGTLTELTQAITSHMGPAGLVIMNAFNQSKAAAGDLKLMLAAMPGPVRHLAKEFESGSLTMTQFRKALPTNDMGMISQFTALYGKVHGFNDLIKAGSPAAQTYTAAMAKMTGGATGLNTALLLGGSHMATFAANTRTIAAAAVSGAHNVQGWATVQQDLGFKIAAAKDAAGAFVIEIGQKLIPVVTHVLTTGTKLLGFFEHNRAAAIALGVAVGGPLVLAIAAYTAKTIGAGVTTVKEFLTMTKAGATWVAEHATQLATWVAQSATAMAGWVAQNTVKLATWVAENTVAAATTLAEWATTFAGMVVAALPALAEMLVAFAPFILTIGAIGIAAYELYTHWHTVWGFIKRITGDAVSFVKSHLLLIVSVALGPIGIAAGLLFTHWHQVWSGIKTITAAVWHFLDADVFRPIIAGAHLIGGAVTALLGVWSSEWNAIKTAAQAVWHFLDADVFRPIIDVGLHVIQAGVQTFSGIWASVWHGIQSVVAGVWSFLQPIFGAISGAIHAITGGLSSVSHLAGSVGHGIGGALGSVGKFLGLAEGGVVTRPTLALIGEGGETEYVVPQSKLAGFMTAMAPQVPRQSATPLMSAVSMSPAPGGVFTPAGGPTPGSSSSAGGPAPVYLTYNPQITITGTSQQLAAQLGEMLEAHDQDLIRALRASG